MENPSLNFFIFILSTLLQSWYYQTKLLRSASRCIYTALTPWQASHDCQYKSGLGGFLLFHGWLMTNNKAASLENSHNKCSLFHEL